MDTGRESVQESATASNNAVLLTFVVGPYRLCSSSQRVVGIIAPPPLARLPGGDRCQRGIFFHHGRTALVLGLRCKFGLPRRTHNDSGQLILVEIGNELAAFWVDEVLDAPETQYASWRETPPALRNGVFDRLAVLNQQLYLYVDFEKLLYARSEDVAAALGVLAPTADKTAGEAARDIPVESRPVNESEASTHAPLAVVGVPLADVPPVASRPPARTTPARIALVGSATPRQRTSGPKPLQRAMPSLARTHTHSGAQARDGGSYATSGAVSPTAHAPDPAEKRNGDDSIVAWAWGTVAMTVLLTPLLWLWLSSSDRAGAKTVVAATNPSAAIETMRTETASAATPPAPSTYSGTATPRAGQTEIMQVDTTDFVLTVERSAQPDRNPAAEAKGQPHAPAYAATPPAAAKGPGDWQEITHVVVRGDTLWDIARQYLGNPFKYPELAKLSQVRNPDLIHPGDRIHIKKKLAARSR